MNIWIVQGSSGQYDDYWTWAHKAFYSHKAAQAWIDRQADLDYQALEELEILAAEYRASLPMETPESEEQWIAFCAEEEKVVQKATEEIQAKYPSADLTQSYDFNGYRIIEQPIELEEI